MSSCKLIYAASETCADLWYLSGFSAPDPFLYVDIAGFRAIVVSALEVGRAVKEAAQGVHVMSIADARARWHIKQEWPSTAQIVLAIARETAQTQWDVPQDFPFSLAKHLMDKGLTIIPAGAFAPSRQTKTALEIEHIREAIRMTETGLARAIEILSAATIGQDDILYWNGAVLKAEDLGGEINLAIMRAGGTATGTITAPGVQGADPHCQGYGPIHAHEPIVMDVFPRASKTGYFGDLTRTVCKGSAPDIVRKTFDTVYAAQKLAISLIKPGVPGCEPHNAVVKLFNDAGYVTDLMSTPARGFFHSLGHSIGLEIHEGPGLNKGNTKPLEIGNVVTVEPGLYYPEWGGIRIEDDVVVTADGCEKLSSAEVFLEV